MYRSTFVRLSALAVMIGFTLSTGASRVRAQAARGLFSDELDTRALTPAAGAAGNPMVLRSRTAAVNRSTLTSPGPAGGGTCGTTPMRRSCAIAWGPISWAC
jgi:hypothetical protein